MFRKSKGRLFGNSVRHLYRSGSGTGRLEDRQDAIERDIKYEVTVYGLDDLDRAIADGEECGSSEFQLLERIRSLVSRYSEHAGDLTLSSTASSWVKHEQILGTVHIYPTWTEPTSLLPAAGKGACTRGCWVVERFHAPGAGLRPVNRPKSGGREPDVGELNRPQWVVCQLMRDLRLSMLLPQFGKLTISILWIESD